VLRVLRNDRLSPASEREAFERSRLTHMRQAASLMNSPLVLDGLSPVGLMLLLLT